MPRKIPQVAKIALQALLDGSDAYNAAVKAGDDDDRAMRIYRMRVLHTVDELYQEQEEPVDDETYDDAYLKRRSKVRASARMRRSALNAKRVRFAAAAAAEAAAAQATAVEAT